MYFSKRSTEPLELIQTSVWMCCDTTCYGWMREKFSFDKQPLCPLCTSNMEKKLKMLPVL
ncbi:cold-shock protein [Paenibacillus cremeus]|uniref:Cold-shock protein n=1 Tax=Paenibacillus cremeus TaxID=2163881 RepID=A0A559JMH1_9BACL|nr:cold-shock protein [Paenibacillus cremeus]